jgi:uncharacterized protein YukE
MSASAAFGEMLDALGIWWPRGDGDALRSAADGWQQTAEIVDEITAVLTTVSSQLVENYHGESATRFAETWSKWSGDTGYLTTTATDARRLAAALADFGTDIDVADRTLVQLIEQALTAPRATPGPAPGTLPAMDDPWMVWLWECAEVMRGELATRANRRNDELAEVTPHMLPPAPNTIDVTTIRPANITWPDPGQPVDLSDLADEPVDFGAGEGRLPVTDAPDVGEPPNLWAPSGGGPVNITIVGDNNTVTVGTGVGLPTTPTEPTDDVVEPIEPITELPPDSVPEVLEDPLAGLGGGGGGFGGGGGGFGGGGFDASAFDLPEFEPLVDPVAPLAANDPVPVSISPPMPTQIAGVGAVTAGAVAAKNGASRMPMMPFLPMGGMAGGGDDANEPKRRKRRPPLDPPLPA